MALKLRNTLTRKLEEFKPLKEGSVTLYTCGPTVYGAAQIGNLRTYVWEDVLRRWLKYGHGLAVKQVLNITDVEDKIIKASKAKTVTDMATFTEPLTERFFADIAALEIERAEVCPRATEYVPQMIKLAEAIIKAGYGYERDDSVYFDVRKYDADHGYGKLLKVDFAEFEQHHRIDNDEYDKESVQDFALWKSVPKDTPGWDSPWGHGRPGWHIECSAMAAAELGETIDIHTGGVDNIFPHHENEIAQSQAAHGKPLANFWLHGEHLLVDGEKMAKSAGNFYTLADVTKQGIKPVVLRLLYLQAHYRSKLNFTWESLAAAGESHGRIQEFLLTLSEATESGDGARPEVAATTKTVKASVTTAMDDDLNTAQALAVVFDAIRDLNTLNDQARFSRAEAAQLEKLFDWLQSVLGVFERQDIKIPAVVAKLVKQREEARVAGDFKKADLLRKQIEQAGFTVEDTDTDPRLRPS